MGTSKTDLYDKLYVLMKVSFKSESKGQFKNRCWYKRFFNWIFEILKVQSKNYELQLGYQATVSTEYIRLWNERIKGLFNLLGLGL